MNAFNPEFMREYGLLEDEESDGFVEWLSRNGYTDIRRLEDGSWIGLMKLMFTTAICVGITKDTPYEYRWCCPDLEVALHELAAFTHLKHIPTKGSYVAHRYINRPLVMECCQFGFPKW